MTSTRHFNAEICFLRPFHWIRLPSFGAKLRDNYVQVSHEQNIYDSAGALFIDCLSTAVFCDTGDTCEVS